MERSPEGRKSAHQSPKINATANLVMAAAMVITLGTAFVPANRGHADLMTGDAIPAQFSR
jgi:hypothetical protein